MLKATVLVLGRKRKLAALCALALLNLCKLLFIYYYLIGLIYCYLIGLIKCYLIGLIYRIRDNRENNRIGAIFRLQINFKLQRTSILELLHYVSIVLDCQLFLSEEILALILELYELRLNHIICYIEIFNFRLQLLCWLVRPILIELSFNSLLNLICERANVRIIESDV